MATLAAGVLTSALALPSTATATPAARGIPAFSHVFEVVMENLGYSSALQTPGLARLARRWASASDYYAASHPSLPNYLALSSGSTHGITSDCVTCFVSAANLFSELANRHVSFDAYLEGVPGPCFLADYGGNDYASKHNPFRYYNDVRGSRSLCSHLRPYNELAGLLRGPPARVPRYVWVTPNLCHDGHDCGAGEASTWLTSFVAQVTSSAAWRDGGVLLVTWDEGFDSSAVVNGRVVPGGGGGHVLTLVISPAVARGKVVAAPLNHYSLLATVEDALGLPRLGAARGAANFSMFFR
jgi:phosphatidylinositol-3-phosphatase